MRLAPLYARTAALAALLVAVCSCQSAHKPPNLLPPARAPQLAQNGSSASPAKASAPATATTPNAPQNSSATVPAQKPAGAAAPNASTQSDAVADLIARVEKEYQAGLTSYHAGKTDDAKQHFDNAFNALLDSNLDIRSDDRLQKEFDHIALGADQLKLGAPDFDAESQAGSDQSPDQAQDNEQQKSEPAPIDETNALAPSADARTLARAEADIKKTHSDLPLMMTDQVAGYIAYFQGRGRGVFERAFARSGRYHDMIIATLKQQGVPQDLIYLAQAESGFHPLAVSRVGARGIWQFMGARARGYGLYHNMWVDDRQDPEKSTLAAAHHLKDLYNQFGDWYLAMAAYNSGPGTVQAAVKRTGYADFWELYRRNVLPKETRNYVPIILAVTIMAKNPSQYGLDDVVMDHPLDFDTVTINYPIDLRLVADCVNSSVAELQDLNPSLLRLSTPRQGDFQLHLPAGTKDQYQTEIAAIPAPMRLSWRYHTVESGDTLAALARRYHVTTKSISAVNHLDGAELESNAKLIIPIVPGKHSNDSATYARRITRYHVRRGDTVESVADNFGISPKMLRRWNGLHGSSLAGRRVLALHLPISPGSRDVELASRRSKSKRPAAGSSNFGTKDETATSKPPATKSAEIARLTADKDEKIVHHRVKTGETLYSIATLYRTTVAALKRDNRNVAVLRPGMILIVQVAH
jgi:membrane-bound lytic murein transglycosylase D